MPTIYDNIENILLDGIKIFLDKSTRADFCVGYFNLRGWKEVADYIDRFSGKGDNKCRLLIGMQKQPEELIKEFFYKNNDFLIDNQTANRIRKELAKNFRDQLTIGIPTEEDEIGLRKLSRQIKQGKVSVKLFLKYPLHAKLYLAFRDDRVSPVIGFLGSSNLTLAGLIKQGELNVDVIEQDAANKLANWFEERWNDRWCIDISKELTEIIDTSWATEKPYPPYYIYLKIAYHLSREARLGLSEFKIPKIFKDELLEFQQKAVLIAVHHLNKRNGVIIGDVVGLGKTLTATAVAKIMEDDFGLETLIICPKNLTEMWERYAHKYQLRAKVLSLSRVLTELPNLRRYRVVIIDESQNLRNREGKRYRAIKEYISLNDCKVILLSATPYNKSYLDLSSQIRLFVEDDQDLGIAPERLLKEIGGREEFVARYQYSERTILAFEKSEYPDDWRELMRLYMIRRPRSFIKEHYALYDEEKKRKYLLFSDGRRSYFPDRIPKKVEFGFNEEDPNDQYAKLYTEEVVNKINQLNLPRYGLGNYIIEELPADLSEEQEKIIKNLSRAGKRLMGFARTNLFKRLESSGHSFLLSIARHILRNHIYIYALKNNLPIPIGEHELNQIEDFLDDKDYDEVVDDENNIFDFETKAKNNYLFFYVQQKDRFDWLDAKFFKDNLLVDLIEDVEILSSILNLGKNWKWQDDRKIRALYDLCTKTHPKEKVLIFTQYADTAKYLFNALKELKVDKVEFVTGEVENPTEYAERFSPRSNEVQDKIKPEDEIRVLISTDVLSEGQNLQDCYIVVNYDLPWAIIKLIQRAGRVDRIGQTSDKILCYSFLPEDGVEKIIRLRSRLKERIQQNAEVVGSDEVFFEGDPINIIDLYNEKAGLLDDEDDNEVDLSSYAYQIWKNAIDKDKSLEKIIPDLPNVIYSTKYISDKELKENSVVVYARTYDDNDVLVLVNEKGELISQSQFKILKIVECDPETNPLNKLQDHHNIVKKGLEYIRVVEKKIGGQLGKKSSARYRVYNRLIRYYEETKETLFENKKLKQVIEEIYKFPLKEYAKDVFNRQLKAGINDEQLAELTISLYEDDKLCIVSEEEDKYKEPQIICSLGLRLQ